MAVTAERFNQGMTYAQFKSAMTRNQERFAQNEQRLQLATQDVATFRSLPKPVNVMVIAEDWCGDVIDNLPIIGRLAEESGKINARVFLRDQNLDLIDQYLKHGKFRSIPVFVFFDDEFSEIGRFIERPDRVTERRNERRRAIYAENPEFGSPDTPADQLPEDIRGRLTQAIQQMRQELKTQENQDVLEDLRAIVANAGR